MSYESTFSSVIDVIAEVYDWNAVAATGTMIGEATCNKRGNAILAVQNTLGVSVQGSYDSVAERLDVMDALIPASQIKHMYLDVFEGMARASGPCSTVTQIESSNYKINSYVADFDPDTSEFMQWQRVMPDDYDGATVTAKFIWQAESATGSGVTWCIQAVSLDDGLYADAEFGDAQSVTDANNGENMVNITEETGEITISGTPLASNPVVFQAYRYAEDTSDTLETDARLRGVLIFYTRT